MAEMILFFPLANGTSFITLLKLNLSFTTCQFNPDLGVFQMEPPPEMKNKLSITLS